MSMLSAQCDELRKMADQLQEHGTFVGFGGTTNTDPLMHGAATAMREAADTIWELRDDLQRANEAVRDAEHDESRAWDRVRKVEAEAERLREERDMYRDLVDCMVHPDIPDQLAAENAKLRELCRDVFAHEAIDCERCAYGKRCRAHETTCYTAGIIIRKRAHELGADDV